MVEKFSIDVVKIMHLADLHLGKRLLEQSLMEDEEYIIKEIIDIVLKQSIDVVMVCGDVYDKDIPSIEAVKLFNYFLTELSKMGVVVLVISGNHDSRDRLSFGSELFSKNNVYIEGGYNGNLKRVTLKDEYGNVNFYMLPFIKPVEVRRFFEDREIESYEDMIKVVFEGVNIDTCERNVIMLHQFVTSINDEVVKGGENLSIGGIDNIDVSNFWTFDYVAMGHIHRGQKVLRDNIRYSGSPLKFSFSEVDYDKSIPIIDLGEKGNVGVNLVGLKPLRDLRIIRGPFKELVSSSVVSLFDRNDYLQVILTDDDYIMDAIGKLRSVYPNVLKMEYCNMRTMGDDEDISFSDDIKKKSEFDLFSEFYLKQNNKDMSEDEKVLVKDIIRDVSNE